MLHEFYVGDGPLDLDDLAGAVAAMESDAAEGGAADGEPCPDCGEVHDSAGLPGIGGLLDALVAGEVPASRTTGSIPSAWSRDWPSSGRPSSKMAQCG
jgi:hypothetical protein